MIKEKVKWLAQDVGISSQQVYANFQALEQMKEEFGNFGVISNTKLITNLENILLDPDEGFIIRGGTKMLTLLDSIDNLIEVCPELSPEQIKHEKAYKKQLRAGIFYDKEKFDQKYYSSLGLPLLNEGASFYSIRDNLNRKWQYPVFIKPSMDQKAFTPGILEPGVTIEEFIKNQKHSLNYINEFAVIAPVQAISEEYRFFVVMGEAVTGSMYKLGERVVYSELVPQNIWSAAKDYAKLYAPHDVFTMDLCVTDKGIKIVEYNCWNASGLYKTDIGKIFFAVKEYKEFKMKEDRQNTLNFIASGTKPKAL